MTASIEKVFTMLNGLGNSSKEVAQSLIERGIKGDHFSISCPIAIAINKIDSETPVDVWYSGFLFGTQKYKLPQACSDFVRDFDNLMYPLLIDNNRFDNYDD